MNTESVSAMALDSAAWTAGQTAALQRTGWAPATKALADPILCRCTGVSRAAVVQAVAAGAASFEQVRGATGCGSVCGACRWRVNEVFAAVTGGAYPIAERRGRAIESRVPVGRAGAQLFRDQLVAEPPDTIAQRLRRHAVVAQGMLGLAVLFLLSLVGVFAVPIAFASGAIGAATATICGVIIAVVLAVDTQSSYEEWRRIFFEEMSDDDVLKRGAQRPPMFRRSDPAEGQGTRRAAAIRGFVMRRLSFRQWLSYKFTLRLDYLINDIWRAAVHNLRKSLLRRGFRSARAWSRLYQPFWEHVDRQLAELVIESSLMLGLTETWSDPTSGHTHGRFVYTDWICPANPRFKDEAVHIDRFEVVVDLDRRRALSAAVNGREIGAGEDALVLADLCVSLHFHPMLHAYANWACVPNHPDPVLAQAAVYTLAMNGQAWHAGYFANTVAANFRRILLLNTQRGIFAHGSGALMQQIMRFSRTGAFLMAARSVTMDVLREHQVDIDPEAFFLMSVLHSVDHHVIAAAVDPVNLHSTLLDYRGMEWIRVLFQEPLRPILANTRISAQKSGWVADLYKRLCAIDPWYADRVDYCIRY